MSEEAGKTKEKSESDFKLNTQSEFSNEYFDNNTDEINEYNLNDDLDTTKFFSHNKISEALKRKSIIFSGENSIAKKIKNSFVPTENNIENNFKLDNRKNDLISNQIDRLCEYIEVLMHCLLFKTNYYNKKTHFDKYLKYNIIVYKCKSEIVCEYITNCVECVRILLYKNHKLNLSQNESLNVRTDKPVNVSIGFTILRYSKDENLERFPNLLLKRYTLQMLSDVFFKNNDIELNEMKYNGFSLDIDSLNGWNLRDTLLKCLYSKEVKYPINFSWQIQIKTSESKIKQLTIHEDLFKLFAWRKCNIREITPITNKESSENFYEIENRLAMKPIKTFCYLNKKIQFFIEQPCF